MPRRNLILQSDLPYAVTARSNNKEWFDVPMPICWEIFEDAVARTSDQYGVETHGFVLMSNHFHWLVSTPKSNLGDAMRFFMTESSRAIARSAGRINKIYGARYKWTLITNAAYYANTVRYFYQNPLRARICSDVDSYRWSTRSLRSKIVLCDHPFLGEWIPDEETELRAWLNEIPPGPFQQMMQMALRRTEFAFPRHPTLKRNFDEQSFLVRRTD